MKKFIISTIQSVLLFVFFMIIGILFIILSGCSNSSNTYSGNNNVNPIWQPKNNVVCWVETDPDTDVEYIICYSKNKGTATIVRRDSIDGSPYVSGNSQLD